MPAAYPVGLNRLLLEAVEKHASDLHLAPGASPAIRCSRRLVYLDYPILNAPDVTDLVFPILADYQQREFKQSGELDFAYAIKGLGRFRGNMLRQRGTVAVAFRLVPYDPPRLKDLGLPLAVGELAYLPRGLVLITGPTGSGKSTTLAALLNQINEERSLHLITIEEPIEFFHQSKCSLIKQREVGTDTRSFAEALKRSLRHDPDVLMIGEMRDLTSTSIALQAAETGHLVFSSLHTPTAPLAISRVVNIFPEHRREGIRQQLASTIQAVVAQQILPRVDAEGLAAAVEVMLATPAIRNLIREGKEHQIYNVMQTNRNIGMQTMDQALADLVQQGQISPEDALGHGIDKGELQRLLLEKSASATTGSGNSMRDRQFVSFWNN